MTQFASECASEVAMPELVASLCTLLVLAPWRSCLVWESFCTAPWRPAWRLP